MRQIADTGFLVAYWNKADVHHRWARRLTVNAPLRSCEAVLTETAYLLGTPVPILQMLADGDLTTDFQAEKDATDLILWLEKFADLDPGFTDACVVKLGELNPREEILTTDRRDFSAYRTLGGKPLRCVFPPL